MATQIELQEKLNLAHGRMMEQLPKSADTGEVDYENGEWADDDAQAKYKAAVAEVQMLNAQLEVYNTINQTKNQQDLAAANIAAKAGISVDEAVDKVAEYTNSVEAFIKFGTQGNKLGKMTDEQISYMGNLNLAGSPGGRESFALDTTAADKGANMVPDEVSSDILLELREVNPIRGLASVRQANTGRKKTMISIDATALRGAGKAENVAVAALDPRTAGREINFAYIDSGAVPLSDEVVMDAAPGSLLADVRSIVVEVVGVTEGIAMTESTANAGALADLVGWVSDATVGHTTASNSAVVLNDVRGLYTSLKARHRRNSTWQFAPSLLDTFMAMATTTNLPIWQPGNVAQGLPGTIYGRPYVENEDLPDLAASSKSIALGNFRAFVIEDVPSAERFFRADENNDFGHAQRGQISFLYRRRVGFRLRSTSGDYDAVKVLQTRS